MTRKILHVVESITPDAGNVAVLLPGLVAALSAQNYECKIVADHDETQQGVDWADVVHIHGWGYDSASVAATHALKRGAPYVISPLGGLLTAPDQKLSIGNKIRKLLTGDRLVQSASVILACNEFERSTNEMKARCNNIQLLPYGINFDQYSDSGAGLGTIPKTPEGRCLLVMGPMHPIEGLVPLLKAFAQVGSVADGWFVAIVGREVADWRKTIEAAIRRKGGEARVVFSEASDVATQRAWLARASLLACMSLHVRCPVSIMQALAVGLPVLASDRVALQTTIGAVCAPSRERICKELTGLLSKTDQQLREASAKQYEAAHSALDWSQLAPLYADHYRKLFS